MENKEAAREQFRRVLKERDSNKSKRKELLNSTITPRKEFDHAQYQRLLDAELASNAALIEARKKAQVKTRVDTWFNKIEERWQDATLSKLTDPDIIKAIEDRLERHEKGDGLNQTSLMISGTYGKGKTYAGYAYAYELISAGALLPSQVFINTERALVDIATGGYEKSEKLRQLLNPHYRFYLIDDVGRGTYQNAAQRGEVWYELLNHVYVNRLTLVLTTNLVTTSREGGNTISSWMGNAAVDRLRHLVGASGNIVMSGDDKRSQLGTKWEEDYKARRS